MDSWLIPAAPVRFVEEIKKSRFITLLAHTDGVMAAKAFVESVRADHPDARHHCVAWVAGRRMIHNSWVSPTMANRRERQVNRCWHSLWAAVSVR
ncbi:IMPACT family member yigZ [Raoultella terrigena]|uniref:IMPACT family member yigZ n=1 Tax=Raoultella terrigena TaxID=577 RepID=A0A485ARI6_RAOTE|nr:IMPACT family member yigZ [Raoultella terrigena]